MLTFHSAYGDITIDAVYLNYACDFLFSSVSICVQHGA